MLLPLCRVATNLVRRLCERGECEPWMRFPAACFGAVAELSLVHRGGSCSPNPALAGWLHPCISAHCPWLFRNAPGCADPGIAVHQHTGGGAEPPLLCGKYTVTLPWGHGDCVHRNEPSEALELSCCTACGAVVVSEPAGSTWDSCWEHTVSRARAVCAAGNELALTSAHSQAAEVPWGEALAGRIASSPG